MKTLLSFPPDVASYSGIIPGIEGTEYFVSSDPVGKRLGSGGGSAWLLTECMKKSGEKDFESFLANEKKILVHAGGQSRRLPSYASCGKILTPVPVFRWSIGQKIDQTLLDIQLSLYRKLIERVSERSHVLIASGDVLLRYSDIPLSLPDADVICLTTWIDSSVATRHGVLFAKRETPGVLDFMLQKPTAEKIEELLATHVFMMDTGCWILSDKAVAVLMKKCGWNGSSYENGIPCEYDFYTSFGESLGEHPVNEDSDISSLTCAIVNPEGGEFYHYGTSRELISSTERIQNLVNDPREILQRKVKAHPSLFVQNASVGISWKPEMRNIWIENSCVPSSWTLAGDSIITGVPENKWSLTVPQGVCIDVVPVKNGGYCLRVYGIDDMFRGHAADEKTMWMGQSLSSWCKSHNFALDSIGSVDIQNAPLFPVVSEKAFYEFGGELVQWMISSTASDLAEKYSSLKRLSADEIMAQTDLGRYFAQRDAFRKQNLPALAANYKKSVFYQCDLSWTASLYEKYGLQLPSIIDENDGAVTRMRSCMFNSQVERLRGLPYEAQEQNAFSTLRNAVLASVEKVHPVYDVVPDQIVWGRSPARIDIAGGWSDTPPYSMYTGGAVVNFALDMNGQQPIQVYVRKVEEKTITIRSIDTGAAEKVTTYESLLDYNKVKSSFSIPKAALCLAGFGPEFSTERYSSLEDQLGALGGGLEISLLAAIPKGSGLGTSSILAATVLGTLSEVCSLGWSKQEVCLRSLALEQLLTSGGGWQDQFGGVYSGIKLVESASGVQKNISVRKLPSDIFTDSETAPLWLLYYTGITRVAKNILSDIVRNMFLNNSATLDTDGEIKRHAYRMTDAVQFADYAKVAEMVKYSWQLNKQLDSGVSSPAIDSLISKIDDYAYGYKLAGAGGGGFMLICAKDIDAVSRIKKVLGENKLNDSARFVKMTLDTAGMQISRS